MKTTLTRPVPVHRFATFAELAVFERRPELGLLCKAAQANQDRMTTAAIQQALPGVSDAGAANIIASARDLGLCDNNGSLTRTGREVAQTMAAPIPEQGVYELWIADDPVLPERPLAFERLYNGRHVTTADLRPLPLKPAPEPAVSMRDPNCRFMVRGLPSNSGRPRCELRPSDTPVQLQWQIDFTQGEGSWRLTGALDNTGGSGGGRTLPIAHHGEPGPVEPQDILRSLARGPLRAHGRWDDEDGVLEVPFRGLKPDELRDFRKSLPLGTVEIPGYGSFHDVTVEQVPIGPEDDRTAQTWALALLDRALTEDPAYRQRIEVRRLFSELVEGTPLAPFEPSLPTHEALLGRGGRNPERFWALAAPVDLAPHPIEPELLDEAIVALDRTDQDEAAPDQFRLGYGSGWSMRDLTEALRSGATPSRVVLVDRYVRRNDNFDALDLFVRALREAAPSLRVEVCTEQKDTSAKKIERITGSAPRWYHDVFGKAAAYPHDRYVLIEESSGQIVGWQLSNSPLHARPDGGAPTPETPLRWKDLTAFRLAFDELDPALKHLVGASPRA